MDLNKGDHIVGSKSYIYNRQEKRHLIKREGVQIVQAPYDPVKNLLSISRMVDQYESKIAAIDRRNNRTPQRAAIMRVPGNIQGQHVQEVVRVRQYERAQKVDIFQQGMAQREGHFQPEQMVQEEIQGQQAEQAQEVVMALHVEANEQDESEESSREDEAFHPHHIIPPAPRRTGLRPRNKRRRARTQRNIFRSNAGRAQRQARVERQAEQAQNNIHPPEIYVIRRKSTNKKSKQKSTDDKRVIVRIGNQYKHMSQDQARWRFPKEFQEFLARVGAAQ